MKKIYFDAIRSGRKTTTLRFWKRRRVRPGSVHTVPGLGRVRVEDVDVIDPTELTDADAEADGFSDAVLLQRALDEHYPPEQRPGRKLYRVRFRFPAG
ncbi:MAG: ASCH domain-containing protein [Planctomycetota bacterium]